MQSNENHSAAYLVAYALALVGLFILAARYESSLPGDFEWGICYGAVFIFSATAHYLTRSYILVPLIAFLAPLSALGMFFIVNMILGLLCAALGLSLGCAIRQIRGYRAKKKK